MANPFAPPGAGESDLEQARTIRRQAVTVDYELTEDDYVAFAVQHGRQRFGVLRIFLFVVGVAMLALGVVTPLVMSIITGAIVVLLAAWLGSAHQVRWGVRRARGRGQQLVQLGAWQVTINSHGVSWTTPTTESRSQWAAIERIAELRDHVLIYTNAVSAVVVPRRAFGSAESVKTFVETAQWHLSFDRHLRKAPLYAKPAGVTAARVALIIASWLLLIVVFLFIWAAIADDPERADPGSSPSSTASPAD